MGFDATGGKPYKANQDGPLWYLIVLGVVLVSFVAVFFGPKCKRVLQAGIVQNLNQSLPVTFTLQGVHIQLRAEYVGFLNVRPEFSVEETQPK